MSYKLTYPKNGKLKNLNKLIWTKQTMDEASEQKGHCDIAYTGSE